MIETGTCTVHNWCAWSISKCWCCGTECRCNNTLTGHYDVGLWLGCVVGLVIGSGYVWDYVIDGGIVGVGNGVKWCGDGGGVSEVWLHFWCFFGVGNALNCYLNDWTGGNVWNEFGVEMVSIPQSRKGMILSMVGKSDHFGDFGPD